MIMQWFARARRLQLRLGLIVAAVLCPVANANAALILNVGSVTASAGSSGNALDLTLANTGSTAVTGIGGFGFEIMVPSNSSITFTAVNTSTTTSYIFAGNSVFGPNIAVQPPNLPGQLLEALDISSLVSGVTINANSSLGLGHVLFNVGSGAASGSVTVTPVAFPTTNLSNASGGNMTLGSLNSGSIAIQGLSVPEPSSLLMGVFAGATLIVAGWLRRRVGCRSLLRSAAPTTV
jgi:hypothetical protein